MPALNPTLLKGLILKNNRLFVSDSIVRAIELKITSMPEQIEAERIYFRDTYSDNSATVAPVHVCYSQPERIDAYTIQYLPRNTLIARMALLCCSYHPGLQTFPDNIRVLDVGSGTGAAILGLIDLFNNQILSHVYLDITAVDNCTLALERQINLVSLIALNHMTHNCINADFSNPNDYVPKLSSEQPFDIILAGNILGELDPGANLDLLRFLSGKLKDTGILVSGESDSNYV